MWRLTRRCVQCVRLRYVLKQSRPVLTLAFLDPVAVDPECASVDGFADGSDAVRVLLDTDKGYRALAGVTPQGADCNYRYGSRLSTK